MPAAALELDATHRDVRLSELSMHVAEAGEGPPLLLLHGWPQHGLMWRRVLAPLAARNRVIVPDLRGFGRSDAPPGSYLKRTLAGDAVELLDALEIERVAVVGHDWGAWVSWLLALEHPERVERFAALDVGPPWPGRRSPSRLARFATFATYQYLISTPILGEQTLRSSPRFVRGFIRAGAARKDSWTDEELDAFAVPLQEPPRARASVRVYRSFLTRELPSLVAGSYAPRELTVPGLQVFGEKSPVLRATGLPEPTPGLAVEVIPGTGHFIPEEAPQELLALLEPFLART